MADKNPTASGATRGSSYVLPWDTIAQYGQLVEQTKQHYADQNQQKMSKIADMEQNPNTTIPVHDKALENYYESLHGEMGKVLTKYPDPFSSLDGMRELKGIQGKYLNNEYLTAATKTKASYSSMMEDYKAGRISEDDFKQKESQYNEFVSSDPKTNGAKSFEYLRPEYTQLPEIFSKQVTKFKESIIDQSANHITQGFSDEQLSDAYDSALLDIDSSAMITRVNANLQHNQVDITADSQKKEALRLMRVQYPLDKRNIYHEKTGGGDGIGFGGYRGLDYEESLNPTGSMDPQSALVRIPKATDGSIAGMDSIIVQDRKFNFTTKSKAVVIAADKYNDESKQLNSRIVMPKQNFINDNVEDFEAIASKAITGTNKNYFNTVSKRSNLTRDEFISFGLAKGYTEEEAIQLRKDYLEGKLNLGETKVKEMPLMVNGISPQSQETVDTSTDFSLNPFLLNSIRQTTTVTDRSGFTPEYKATIDGVIGWGDKKEFVYIDNVQLSPQNTIDQVTKRDVGSKIPTKVEELNQAVLATTRTFQHIKLGNGILQSGNHNGVLNGFLDYKTSTKYGEDNFQDIFKSRDVTNAVVKNYKNHTNISQKEVDKYSKVEYQKAMRLYEKDKSLSVPTEQRVREQVYQNRKTIFKMFPGMITKNPDETYNLDAIQQYLGGGENNFLLKYNDLNARYKVNDPSVVNRTGIDKDTDEMILRIGKEYYNLVDENKAKLAR